MNLIGNCFAKGFAKSVLAATFAATLTTGGCYGGFIFELQDSFFFTKNNQTVEHLDHGNFEGTAATTDWTANKKFTAYVISAKALYLDKCTNLYGLVRVNYGWIEGGRVLSYPLRWDSDGYSKGYALEVGHTMDVCGLFNFNPYVGFLYGIVNTTIKNQHFAHVSPDSFVKQNGNKSRTALGFPYVGIEIDFKTRFRDWYDVNFFASYQFGYGSGHGTNTVPHFFVTDNPATSRYGSRVKFRDLINQDFEIGAFYSFAKNWSIGLKLDYNATYNTHKLPLKLQRNSEIVEAGQYTPSQYHVVSDYTSQSFGIIFSLVYNLDGEGGAYIR